MSPDATQTRLRRNPLLNIQRYYRRHGLWRRSGLLLLSLLLSLCSCWMMVLKLLLMLAWCMLLARLVSLLLL